MAKKWLVNNQYEGNCQFTVLNSCWNIRLYVNDSEKHGWVWRLTVHDGTVIQIGKRETRTKAVKEGLKFWECFKADVAK